MRDAEPDPDERITARMLPRRRPKPAITAGAIIVAAALGIAWAVLWQTRMIPIDVQTEAQIDATQPCGIKVSRFVPDPAIVVIDFPNLSVQGLMLDRVAALVEKAHLPRDRVLDDVALHEAIYDCGETIESYYYGHDYRAADLARFFALAAKDGIKLNSQELWLKRLLNQLGWLRPGANGAIITLPAAAPPITEEMRAVILHHELSHGAFFTNPVFAAYSEAFWNDLTEADRIAFKNFLGSEGYDTSNTNLMLNETQAYLVFTRDPKFFNASVVDMTASQINTLRNGFIANMPDFWLTPMANAALPVATAPLSCPTD